MLRITGAKIDQHPTKIVMLPFNILRFGFFPGIFCFLTNRITIDSAKYGMKYSSRRFAFAMSTSTTVRPIESNLIISKSDRNKYEQFILPNEILVTISQDEISEKSSASLSIATGAANDPENYPGLAHFTEHMLFLGTKKYPKENYYKDFLNRNGGSSNGGTGMEFTTYMFDINHQQFGDALDIFSQFFKSPLFNPDSTSREIRAVDAEDSKNRILDSRRVLQVTKNIILPNHPFTKFSTGNAKTLANSDPDKFAEETRAVMSEYYYRYYRPERMTLSLVGPQSLEKLKELAIEHFSGIRSSLHNDYPDDIGDGVTPSPFTSRISDEIKLDLHSTSSVVSTPTPTTSTPIKPENTASVSSLSYSGHELGSFSTPMLPSSFTSSPSYPFHPSFLNTVIRIRPVQEIREISVLWGLPSTRCLFDKNPLRPLLSHILNYRGEGGAFLLLQDKGWISSLSAGPRVDFSDFTVFEVSAGLTTEGLLHWEDVKAVILSHIQLIQQSSFQSLERIWEEIKVSNALDFQYSERDSAYETSQSLARMMHLVPMEHILSAGSLLADLQQDLVEDFLRRLAPQNSVTLLKSPDFTWLPLDNSSYTPPPSPSLATTTTTTADSTVEVAVGEGPSHWEPWYGVPYHSEKLMGENIHKINAKIQEYLPSLSLPPTNPFIAYELVSTEKVLNVEKENIALVTPPTPTPTTPTASELPVKTTNQLENKLDQYTPLVDTDNVGQTKMLGRVIGSQPPKEISSILKIIGEDPHSPSLPSSSSSSSSDHIWLSRDEAFLHPKGAMIALVKSNAVVDGHPILSLYGSVFTQRCARVFAGTGIAGLDYSASFGTRGIGISVSGYHPKMTDLACKVAESFASQQYWMETEVALFENCKERAIRATKSWWRQRPDSQCDSLLSNIMQEGGWLPQDRLAALESVTLEDFKHRVSEILTQTHGMTMYMHAPGEPWGDQEWAVSEVRKSYLQLSSAIRQTRESSNRGDMISKPVKEASSLPRLLPRGTHCVVALPVFNPEEVNSALVCYFQTDRTSSPHTSALLLVLRRLLNEPLFSELRTKRQLGYIVGLSSGGFGNGLQSVRGLNVRVLSNRFSPLEIQDALGEFLESYKSILLAVDQDELTALTTSISKSLQDPPLNSNQEAQGFWEHIINETPFNWIELVLAELATLKVNEVVEAAENWIYNRSVRASISMMMFGKDHLDSLIDKNNSEQVEDRTVMGTEPAFTKTATIITDNSFFPQTNLKDNFDNKMIDFPCHTSGLVVCKSIEEMVTLRDKLSVLEKMGSLL